MSNTLAAWHATTADLSTADVGAFRTFITRHTPAADLGDRLRLAALRQAWVVSTRPDLALSPQERRVIS